MKHTLILASFLTFAPYNAINASDFHDSLNEPIQEAVQVNNEYNSNKRAKVIVTSDVIVFEAEATSSPLGNWKLLKKGDPLFNGIKGEISPVNNTYIEYEGGNLNGYGVKPGEDVLEYTFTPKSSGEYRLTGRMGQRLTVDGKKARTDQCNDIFIKCEGDLSDEKDSLKLQILTNWTKFYGRGIDSWGTFIDGDYKKKKYHMIYKFKAGETYKFTISGRSKNCCIDYFVFSKLPMTIQERKDLAEENDKRFRP